MNVELIQAKLLQQFDTYRDLEIHYLDEENEVVEFVGESDATVLIKVQKDSGVWKVSDCYLDEKHYVEAGVLTLETN